MGTRQFSQLAPGRDFHAALVSFQRGESSSLHDHDFHEVMLVLEGGASHRVEAANLPMAAGDLVLVRPRDRHQVSVPAGGRIRFVNVAFRSELWAQFGELAGAQADFVAWDSAPGPTAVRLSEPERGALAVEMDRILAVFHASASRVDLLRLWTAVLERLLPQKRPAWPSAASGEPSPDWLREACRAMYEPDNLRAGLARFVELSGVSHGHLGRALRRQLGQSPSGFVNDLRLQRASVLLTSTTAPVSEIAHLCGFENVSYFHRQFHELFGRTPRAYRLLPSRLIAPLD